jgi:hypothetical protein
VIGAVCEMSLGLTPRVKSFCTCGGEDGGYRVLVGKTGGGR